jgi:hypothetical protein
VVHFTKQPNNLSIEYIKATQAFAALTYISVTLSIVLSYVIARRLKLSRIAAAAAGAATLVAAYYLQLTGKDPTAVAILFAAIALLNSRIAFGVLIVVSVFVNEKIALTLAMALGLRLIYRDCRRQYFPQLICIGLALVIFAVVVLLIPLPGYAHQKQPSMYLRSLLNSLTLLLTTRGLFLNIWPVMLFSLAAFVAKYGYGYDSKTTVLFRPSDIAVIYGLVVVGMLLNVEFAVGRITSYACALLVIPFSRAAERWLLAGLRNNDTSDTVPATVLLSGPIR